MHTTFILSLDFEENAKLLSLDALSISRKVARDCFMHETSVKYDAELWNGHEGLLVEYLIALNNEWVRRGNQCAYDINLNKHYCNHGIPDEWKNGLLIQSHQWMHYRIYPMECEKFVVHLNACLQYKGLYIPKTNSFTDLPEYMEHPLYCSYMYPRGDRCFAIVDVNFCLHGDGEKQHFCRTHLPMSTEQCNHILLSGERCEKRCYLDLNEVVSLPMCLTHRKYLYDQRNNGETQCEFVGIQGDVCINGVCENASFCHYHRIRKVKECTFEGCTKRHKCKGVLCKQHKSLEKREKAKLEKEEEEQRKEKKRKEKDKKKASSTPTQPSNAIQQNDFEISGYTIIEFTQHSNDDVVTITYLKSNASA